MKRPFITNFLQESYFRITYLTISDAQRYQQPEQQ